jgi:hypothetical protein
VAWALLAGAPALWAHGGLSLQAPLVATAPVIDGAIEQPLWGPDRLGAAAGCQFQHLFALRTATHYYVAVDTPETTIDAADRLVLFFDGNHNGTVNTDTSDRAISLVGFPDGANQTRPRPSSSAGSREGDGEPPPPSPRARSGTRAPVRGPRTAA